MAGNDTLSCVCVWWINNIGNRGQKDRYRNRAKKSNMLNMMDCCWLSIDFIRAVSMRKRTYTIRNGEKFIHTKRLAKH